MLRTAMDDVLESVTPAVVVPKFGQFVPMKNDGHRFLVCADGLWVECRRRWIHAILPMAQQKGSTMPFGTLESKVTLAFKALPAWAVSRFHEEALQHHPKEVGALVTWDERTGEFEYHSCKVIEQGIGHLRQQWPELPDGVWPVLDLHSHGPIKAFFSDEDRKDTGMDVIVAGVVGALNGELPELALSLFACGVEIPAEMPAELASTFKAVKTKGMRA